jgi:tetratricopeptide (TPR) repeat protein
VVLKNNRWKPEGMIKTYYHKGNPVAVLLKRKDKNDFYGISEIKNGNLQKGITLLEQAVRQDTNNVWLHVHLAKATLDLGDEEGFQRALDEGKKIHPCYEPLLLLEASRFFKEGNYSASENKLDTLLRINPRYLPARQLLDEVKKKMP